MSRPFSSRPPLSVDPHLLYAAALLTGSLCLVAPLCSLTTFSICSVILGRCVGGKALAIAGLLLALGWYRADAVLTDFERTRVRVRDALGEPQRCALVGTVVSSPTAKGETLVFTARLTRVDCEGRHIAGGFNARLYGGPSNLVRGDEFDAIGDLGALRLFRNFSLSDPLPPAASRTAVASGSLLTASVAQSGSGAGAWIDQFRAHVRRRIQATFRGPTERMARALVLGDNDFELSERDAFQRSGLAHLLAVSGSHLVLAVVSVVRALGAVLRRISRLAAHRDVARIAAAAGVVLAPLYADFAGGSGSAWRAAIMLMVALSTTMCGRHPVTHRVVALSILIAWLAQPLVVYDYSFLLSLAATAGLCFLAQLATATRRAPTAPSDAVIEKLHRAGLTTLSASLPCLPILLLLSPGLSLTAIAGNLLAGPLGELIALPLCLLHTLMAPWPTIEKGVAIVASGALTLVLELAKACSLNRLLYIELPPPSRWHFATLSCVAAGWLANHASARPLGVGCWSLLATLGLLGAETTTKELVRPSSEGLLRVTSLDVGQGDATWVELPDGRSLLVDGGGYVGSPIDPGRSVLLPTARARRSDRVDIVVLSHPHPDHFGGLLEFTSRVSVGEFWLTGQGLEHSAGPRYERLLRGLRQRGVPILDAATLCQRQLVQPDPYLEVLAPCPHFSESQSANDNSLVLRNVHGQHAALLPGDAEHWAEHELLQHSPLKLKANFLKVGHHGSRTSTSPEFLRAVAPDLAAISCGVRNRFGHPHASTLRTLEAQHVRTFRLDHTGAVQWQTDGIEQHFRIVSDPPLQN